MTVPIRHFVLVVLAAAALAGCSKEPTRPADPLASQPPALPPPETMQLDFRFFDQAAGLSADPRTAEDGAGALSKANWINAAVRVAVIHLVVAHAVAPPALAFQAAIHTRPVLQEDGWFLWTYSWSGADEREVTIRLRGRIDGARVTWQLRVSDDQASPPLDDFLWFHGESKITNEDGFWVFNESKDGEESEVARIDWSVLAEDHRELMFTNIASGTPGLGDRLTYRVDGADVSVLLHDESEGLDADITWNRFTGAGSLQVPDYNDGERACWDEHQNDAECPPVTT